MGSSLKEVLWEVVCGDGLERVVVGSSLRRCCCGKQFVMGCCCGKQSMLGLLWEAVCDGVVVGSSL